jgi:hypothetical protein
VPRADETRREGAFLHCTASDEWDSFLEDRADYGVVTLLRWDSGAGT